jgi:molybdopterin-guanine dinucleotide biosynthesis protein A
VTSAITGVVLCGGTGRRFGSAGKPLARLRGKPLVAHVIERLQPQVEGIVISANRNLDVYRSFDYPVISDDCTDCGPLAGVLAAATRCRSELLFVCPGDAPLLPADLIARMLPLLSDVHTAVVPNAGGRRQHLFMLVRRPEALTIEPYLERGHRSVHGWLEGRRVAELVLTDANAFVNVNTPEQLVELERSGLAI